MTGSNVVAGQAVNDVPTRCNAHHPEANGDATQDNGPTDVAEAASTADIVEQNLELGVDELVFIRESLPSISN